MDLRSLSISTYRDEWLLQPTSDKDGRFAFFRNGVLIGEVLYGKDELTYERAPGEYDLTAVPNDILCAFQLIIGCYHNVARTINERMGN